MEVCASLKFYSFTVLMEPSPFHGSSVAESNSLKVGLYRSNIEHVDIFRTFC